MDINQEKYRLKYLALKNLAIKINSSDDLADIAQEAVDRLIEILDLESGLVSFLDEAKNVTHEALSGSVEKNQLIKEIDKKILKNLREDFGAEFVLFSLEKEVSQTVFSYSIRCEKELVGAVTGLCLGKRDFSSEKDFLDALQSQLALASLKIQRIPEKDQEQKKIIKSEKLSAIMEVAVTINHEINNPLTAILGNVQLILGEKERLDQKTQQRLKAIEKGTLKIAEITKSLLSIIEPVITEYAPGIKMLDLSKSQKKTE